jgi:V8-like Glu-specific endopeptidase
VKTGQILTSDDGTKYEMRPDGTLQPIEARAAGSTHAGCPDAAGRPLSSSELRGIARSAEATQEVPAELRGLWSDLSTRQPAVVKRIRRDAADPPRLLPGHRPLWVGSTFTPRPARRVLRPRVHYRGRALDPLVVWGADERRVYDDLNYPWGCVCKIQNADGQGSGVLVGPRHVLTASHVIDWESGGAATIEVNRVGATVQATARAVGTWSFTRVDHNDSTTLDEDYAVIITDQRLGDRFGWMGVRTYDSDWDGDDSWRSIGYADDVAASIYPVYQRDQNLDEDEWDYGSARAMTTSADVMPGQSGSPIFGFWAEGPYVVAVVAATGSVYASGTENWCSGGNLLTRLVNEARANDP